MQPMSGSGSTRLPAAARRLDAHSLGRPFPKPILIRPITSPFSSAEKMADDSEACAALSDSEIDSQPLDSADTAAKTASKAAKNKKKKEKAKAKARASSSHELQKTRELPIMSWFAEQPKVDLSWSEHGGRQVVAKTDIDAGEEICQCSPCAAVVSAAYLEHRCHQCFGTADAFFVCSGCQLARFCSNSCMSAARHLHLLEVRTWPIARLLLFLWNQCCTLLCSLSLSLSLSLALATYLLLLIDPVAACDWPHSVQHWRG
jgi:hypothetical protein